MKRFLLAVISFATAVCMTAQSDCSSAVSVCDFVYDENNSPTGTGNVFEMAPGSCQTGGEFNSAWYIFSPQTDGLFGFILQPNNNDDYDWSLFDITTSGCAGINTGASPEISCNSYGENPGIPNSPTGISTANGGTGSSNGPGNLFGPPFNEDVAVTAGSVYALVVMNYSSTLDGYALDFTSTAVSIFDNTAPIITNIATNWCTGEVTIELSEEIDVSTLTASDFVLNNTAYSVTAFSTNTPNLASTLQFTIGPLPLAPGTQLELTTINGEILADICDNEVPQPINLDLQGNFFFSTNTTPGCNDTGATIDVDVVGPNLIQPLELALEGTVQPTFFLNDLATGTYNITVTDNLGCTRDTTVNAVSLTSTVTMPSDATLCSLSDTFTAAFTGGLILWDAPVGVAIAQPASGTTIISSDTPGTYSISATVTNQGCTSTGSFSVAFNYPPQSTTSKENASCFGICDGRVLVENGNDASLTITVGGATSTGHTAVVDSLCAGNHVLHIIFSPNCSSTQTISISQPAPVSASFDASEWIVPYANPTVTLTSTSENADSLLWQVLELNAVIFTDSIWELTFPQEPNYYTIQLIASDTSGCTDIFTGIIEVRDEFRVFVANGFTPNDDGINDFIVPSFTYKPLDYRWEIFNRYGDVVFDSKDYLEVWMGEHRNGGYFVPNGIYNYVLTVRGVEHDTRTFKGTISVMR